MDQPIIQKKTIVLFLLLAIFITSGYFFAGLIDKRTLYSLCKVGNQKHLLHTRIENKTDLLITSSMPKDLTLLCLGKSIPYYDKEIEVIILTSVTDLTITELLSISKRYSIKKVYIWKDYSNKLDVLKNGYSFKNIQNIEYVYPHDELLIGDTFRILLKQKESESYLAIYSEDNTLLYFRGLNNSLIDIVNGTDYSKNGTSVYISSVINDGNLLETVGEEANISILYAYIRLPYHQYKDFKKVINLNTLNKYSW